MWRKGVQGKESIKCNRRENMLGSLKTYRKMTQKVEANVQAHIGHARKGVDLMLSAGYM